MQWACMIVGFKILSCHFHRRQLLIYQEPMRGKYIFHIFARIACKHFFFCRPSQHRSFFHAFSRFVGAAIFIRIVKYNRTSNRQKRTERRNQIYKCLNGKIISNSQNAAKADSVLIKFNVLSQCHLPLLLHKIGRNILNIIGYCYIGIFQSHLFIICCRWVVNLKNLYFICPNRLAIRKGVIPCTKNQILFCAN